MAIRKDRGLVEARTGLSRRVGRTLEKPKRWNTQLRFSGLEVGLLLNFRAWPLREGGIRRVVHTRG